MVLIEVRTKRDSTFVNPEQIEHLSELGSDLYLHIGGGHLVVPGTTVAEFLDYLRRVKPAFSRVFT